MLFKKILKAALAAGLVFSFGSTSMAQSVNFGGEVGTYFGMYNTGVKGSASHFRSANMAYLGATAVKDKVTGYIEFELGDNFGSTGVYQDIIKNVNWRGENLSVSMGNIQDFNTLGFTHGSADKAWSIPARHALHLWNQSDGIRAEYALSQMGGSAGITIQSMSNVQNVTVSGNAAFGKIVVKAVMLHVTVDDSTTDTDTVTSESGTLVGVSIPINNISVAVDYKTYTFDEYSESQMGFRFVIKELGPGNLALTYGTKNITMKSIDYKYSDMDLMYDFPINPSASWQIAYLSKATTIGSGTTTNESFMGLGLNVSFW